MRRLKPHQLVVVVGVLAALGALASGIIPRITKWEDGSTISRRAFGDVPDPVYWMFYGVIALMLLAVTWLVWARVRNYERGQPDDRRTTKANAHRRVRD